MEDSETISDSLSIGLDSVMFAWNFTCTNITNNYSLCNSSFDEDYDYDYDTSLAAVPLTELVPVSLVYGLTLVLGSVGNALVVISICRSRQLHTSTNVFLASLSTADLLLICVCVPIKVCLLPLFKQYK